MKTLIVAPMMKTPGMHRINGCFGKLVVRDTKANETHTALYDYDSDAHEVLLADWTNLLAEDYLPGKRSTPMKVDSLLINGYGTYRDPADDTRTFAPLAAFYVQRGKRYRWRVDNAINQGCPIEFCVRIQRLLASSVDVCLWCD